MFALNHHVNSMGKALVVASMLLVPSFSHAASLEQQRHDYQAAIDAIENNQLKTYQKLKQRLTEYPLYPYLEYRGMLKSLDNKSYQQIAAFERQYADLPFSQALRNRYLYSLVKQEKWRDYLKYQTRKPANQAHQCNYYYAHSLVGNKRQAQLGAQQLYLSANSVSNACDKLFDLMREKGQLTDKLILERVLLVFEKGNTSLLNYLVKQLSASKEAEILSWYNQPQSLISTKFSHPISQFQRELYLLSFKRLARIDTAKAIDNFTAIARALRLTEPQKQQVGDYIAGRIMGTQNPKMAAWRDRWLRKSSDSTLLERRFRIALVANDRTDQQQWVALLAKQNPTKVKWRYWQARSLFNQGKTAQANKVLRSILGQRDFYSVAAAMHLNENINIPLNQTKPNFASLSGFNKAFARITELEALNKTAESKREWALILTKANRSQKEMLAAYASNNNWYAHSVQATISGKLWGHLEYRFPIAHRWFFEHFSRENNLPITTLLALSRQESAFYAAAVSPVGARGLMQLMPATAKETSSKLGLSYLGVHTLSDPGTNIRIGSGYLRMLLDKFQQNRILAFAAYNAGPNRVDRWLAKSQGNLDVIAFIEGIPFHETRGYVQNVLMYEVYYRKLLGMPMQFLYKQELAYNY